MLGSDGGDCKQVHARFSISPPLSLPPPPRCTMKVRHIDEVLCRMTLSIPFFPRLRASERAIAEECAIKPRSTEVMND